jgi:transcriptional regulator with XRE-family HTH domain
MLHPKVKETNEHRMMLRQLGSTWLREQRVRVRLSQRAVSDKLGIDSHTFISAIESGGPSLPEDRWEEYAQILEIDWQEFCKTMLMYFMPEIYKALFGAPSKKELNRGIGGG